MNRLIKNFLRALMSMLAAAWLFLGYSLVGKDWCADGFGKNMSSGFAVCTKHKSWWQF